MSARTGQGWPACDRRVVHLRTPGPRPVLTAILDASELPTDIEELRWPPVGGERPDPHARP